MPTKELLQPNELTPFDQDLLVVASGGHDRWREGRKLPDGTYQPRLPLKKTEDKDWVASHGGIDELDIANTNHPDLPRDHQKENNDSARIALTRAYAEAFYGLERWDHAVDFLTFKHTVAEAGDKIHIGWMERNGGWAPSDLMQPYKKLEPDVQKLDDNFYLDAVERVRQRIADGTFVMPEHLIKQFMHGDIAYLMQHTLRPKRSMFEVIKGLVDPYQSARPKGTDCHDSWQLEVPRIVELGDGLVDFRIKSNIPLAPHLWEVEGKFTLENVAQYIYNLRRYAPDRLETGLAGVGAMRLFRKQTTEFLPKRLGEVSRTERAAQYIFGLLKTQVAVIA